MVENKTKFTCNIVMLARTRNGLIELEVLWLAENSIYLMEYWSTEELWKRKLKFIVTPRLTSSATSDVIKCMLTLLVLKKDFTHM